MLENAEESYHMPYQISKSIIGTVFQVLFSSYTVTTDITTDKYQDIFVTIALLADKNRSLYIGTLNSCQPLTQGWLSLPNKKIYTL